MRDLFDGFAEIMELLRDRPAPVARYITSEKVPSGFWRQWMTNGDLIVWMPRWAFDKIPTRAPSNAIRAHTYGPLWGTPVYHD